MTELNNAITSKAMMPKISDLPGLKGGVEGANLPKESEIFEPISYQPSAAEEDSQSVLTDEQLAGLMDVIQEYLEGLEEEEDSESEDDAELLNYSAGAEDDAAAADGDSTKITIYIDGENPVTINIDDSSDAASDAVDSDTDDSTSTTDATALDYSNDSTKALTDDQIAGIMDAVQDYLEGLEEKDSESAADAKFLDYSSGAEDDTPAANGGMDGGDITIINNGDGTVIVNVGDDADAAADDSDGTVV